MCNQTHNQGARTMSDAITFNCTACGKQYRVAAAYGGRDFSCKACGARLSVPQAGAAPVNIEPNVELNSGTEVIRRTTSGRQVTVDPTRVFVKQRETSDRLAAVNALPEAKPAGSKGLVVGIVVGAVVLVLLVGLVAGYLVVIAPGAAGPEKSAQDGDSPAANTPAAESERSRIMKQLDVPGQKAVDFMKLIQEADAARLEGPDMAAIARQAAAAMRAEQAAGYSDAEVLAFAARLDGWNVPMEAEGLYRIVIDRGRGKATKSPEYAKARAKLGQAEVALTPVIEQAAALAASGVIEGADKTHTSLVELQKRSDEGWLGESDKREFDALQKALSTGQAEFDRIARDDPFRIAVVEAERQFKLEKASSIGHWVTLRREPFVFFVQLQSNEDLAGAEKRLDTALAAAEQFPDFYHESLVDALGLQRTLPNALAPAEREKAPLVIKLFRDASYLRSHLGEFGVKIDVTMRTAYTEPGTGHLSMAYKDRATSLGTFIRALIDSVMYNYHPKAPTTREEDEAFRAYQSDFLNDYLHAAISFTNLNERDGLKYTFFHNDTRPQATLTRWRQPFAKAANGSINSFGGQVLTVRDIVTSTKTDGLRETIKEKLGTLPGWTEADLVPATNRSALDTILVEYYRGIFQFFYHWGDGGAPKYRESFLKFIRADLAGSVDRDNPLPEIEAAFGLDAAGWAQLEADFTKYQGG